MEALTEASCKAYAKINLSLDVVGRSPSGMHYLDSVMAPLPIFDFVKLKLRTDRRVEISYSDGRSYPKDNAVKCATAVMKKYGTGGVSIMIEKHIPEGAGFGGSSADGVAVMKLMQKLFNLPEYDNDFLLTFGSDFPYMYKGGTARVQGLGEVVTPIDLPRIKGVAVWREGVKSPTGEVFAGYDILGGERINIGEFIVRGLTKPGNALQKAASNKCEQISNLGIQLGMIGYPNIVMTGSGSAVIGYVTKQDNEYNNADSLNAAAVQIFPQSSVFEFGKDK